MKKKLAVAYVRVSSKSQNVDRQVEELTKYAESVNFKLVRCFNDTAGEQTFEFDKVSDTSLTFNGNTYVKQ